MINKNKAFRFINVKFSYNGDLGILQHKTISNRETCDRLLQNEIITFDEYQEAQKAICEYFTEQINKVAANPLYYIAF